MTRTLEIFVDNSFLQLNIQYSNVHTYTLTRKKNGEVGSGVVVAIIVQRMKTAVK